jgi:predicted peptidase
VRLSYLLHLPDAYRDDGRFAWPLILFLHGISERGDDLEIVRKHGIPKVVDEMGDFPFITLSPQCPEEAWWWEKTEALAALLDDVISRYTVDESRIYLTGLSMGGYGTWALAIAHPERFAAIAPICGGGDPADVCVLKDTPTWVFHGALDETVPLQRSREMVNALRACGGDVMFKIYPDLGHDAWTKTYEDASLYEWFMSNCRPEAR